MQGHEGTGVCDVQQEEAAEKLLQREIVQIQLQRYMQESLFYHSVFKPFVCLYALSCHPS